MADQMKLFPQRKQPGRVLQIEKGKPGRVTQEQLLELAQLQAATNRAAIAQAQLAFKIESALAAGAEIEDGPLYFDAKRMLARSRSGRAVGE